MMGPGKRKERALPSAVAIRWTPWVSQSPPQKVAVSDLGCVVEYELAGLLSHSPSLDLEAEAGVGAGAGGHETKTAPIEENFTSWLQVLGCFCLMFGTWGHINTFSAFQEFYSTELLRDHFPASITHIGSIQMFTMFITAYLLGPLLDAGHLQSILWIGSSVSTLALFITSFCVHFWQLFLAQGMMLGIGFGCLLLPALALPAMYSQRNIGLAMGLTSCGGAMGGLILPVIFNTVRDSFDFAWATQVLAFILLGSCVLPLALLRYPKRALEEEISRLDPGRRLFSWLVSELTEIPAFEDRSYVYLNLAIALGASGFYVMLEHVTLFTRDWTDSNKNVYLSMFEINLAASLVGRTILAAAADRIGAVNMQALTALLSCFLTMAALAMKTADDMIGWSVGFGTCQGAFACLSLVGLVNNSRARVGTRIGTALLLVGVGTFLASLAGDKLLNSRWLWPGLVNWCGLLLLACFACTIAAQILRSRTPVTAKV